MLETPVVKQEFEPIQEYYQEDYHGDDNYEVQNGQPAREEDGSLSRLVEEEGNLTRSKSKKNVTFNMEPPSIVMYETLTPSWVPNLL